jgi:hypothetical protein
MTAAREKLTETALSSPSGEFGDDEEPAWSGIIHKPSGDLSPGVTTPDVVTAGEDPYVTRLLRIIPGTVVN